jgi:tetratricopeptide (TPR) repeat protein
MKFTFVKPNDEELRVMLEVGFILRDASRFDEAKKLFNGVLELIPDSEIPRVGLATVELQRGNYELAQLVCEEALRVKPSSLYAKVHRAESLLFQKKRTEAEQELRSVISTDANSPHSRTAQALLDVAHLFSPELI